MAREDAVLRGDEDGGAAGQALQGCCVVAALGGEAVPEVGIFAFIRTDVGGVALLEELVGELVCVRVLIETSIEPDIVVWDADN